MSEFFLSPEERKEARKAVELGRMSDDTLVRGLSHYLEGALNMVDFFAKRAKGLAELSRMEDEKDE